MYAFKQEFKTYFNKKNKWIARTFRNAILIYTVVVRNAILIYTEIQLKKKLKMLGVQLLISYFTSSRCFTKRSKVVLNHREEDTSSNQNISPHLFSDPMPSNKTFSSSFLPFLSLWTVISFECCWSLWNMRHSVVKSENFTLTKAVIFSNNASLNRGSFSSLKGKIQKIILSCKMVFCGT